MNVRRLVQAIILLIVSQVNDRKIKLSYNFEVLPKEMFVPAAY